jgi:hypothetical protein
MDAETSEGWTKKDQPQEPKPTPSASASRFLALLPEWVPAPEHDTDLDGDTGFDWQYDRRAVLSVSVSDAGRLHYAALIGEERLRGAVDLGDALPAPILYALRLLHPERAPVPAVDPSRSTPKQ